MAIPQLGAMMGAQMGPPQFSTAMDTTMSAKSGRLKVDAGKKAKKKKVVKERLKKCKKCGK